MNALEIEIKAPYRKARVWLSEPPPIGGASGRDIVEEVDTEEPGRFRSRFAAVELMAAAGARALYALVGVAFAPSEIRRCRIRLGVSTQPGLVLPWALVSNFDEVRGGLPSEFSTAVMNELRGVAARLGGGLLSAGSFAYAGAGSSPRFFGFVTCLVGELLVRDPSELSQATIEDVLSTRMPV